MSEKLQGVKALLDNAEYMSFADMTSASGFSPDQGELLGIMFEGIRRELDSLLAHHKDHCQGLDTFNKNFETVRREIARLDDNVTKCFRMIGEKW